MYENTAKLVLIPIILQAAVVLAATRILMGIQPAIKISLRVTLRQTP
jgi:hypothetical protein